MPDCTEEQFQYIRELHEAHLRAQAEVATGEDAYERDVAWISLEEDRYLVRFDALQEFRYLRRADPAPAACFLRFIASIIASGQTDDDEDYSTGKEYSGVPEQAVYWRDMLHHWSWQVDAGVRPPRTEGVLTSASAGAQPKAAVQAVVEVIGAVLKDISASRNTRLVLPLIQLKEHIQSRPSAGEESENLDVDCCERLVQALREFGRSQAPSERKDG